ncbi:MAG: response regulator transcription factor [Bacteroidota bacterium]
MTKINIAVVDDHQIFRKGLITQLEEFNHVKVVGEANNGKEYLTMHEKIHPDIIFMDIKMPELNGIDTTKAIKEIDSNVRIIALSMYDDEKYLQEMLDAGANGFLLKNINKDDLLKAIDNVMKGNHYFSDELVNILTSLFISKSHGNNKEEIPVKLSAREIEVLQLICKGYTNYEIGDMLCISNRTIDGHRAKLIEKVGARNTVGLVTYAIKNKIFVLE